MSQEWPKSSFSLQYLHIFNRKGYENKQNNHLGEMLWSLFNSGGSRGGAGGAPHPASFLDQTEARRAEKIFLGNRLSKGLSPPPLLPIYGRAYPLPPLTPIPGCPRRKLCNVLLAAGTQLLFILWASSHWNNRVGSYLFLSCTGYDERYQRGYSRF